MIELGDAGAVTIDVDEAVVVEADSEGEETFGIGFRDPRMPPSTAAMMTVEVTIAMMTIRSVWFLRAGSGGACFINAYS